MKKTIILLLTFLFAARIATPVDWENEFHGFGSFVTPAGTNPIPTNAIWFPFVSNNGKPTFATADRYIVATMSRARVTNWCDAGPVFDGTGPSKHIEAGFISEDVVATIVWKGVTNHLILESVEQPGLAHRSYRYKKVYEP